MNTVAAMEHTPQGSQMDLFKRFQGFYSGRPTVKHKDCLDCGEVSLKQTFDMEQGIYLGKRICPLCARKTKRKFFTI